MFVRTDVNALPSALRRMVLLALPSLLALTGCRREQIQVQEIPKEPAAPAAAQTASPHGAGMGHGTAAAPALTWTAPEGWQDLGAASMSLANFAASNEVGEITVSIIPLPGIAGRELDVINIFRERFGMPALDSDGLAELATTVTMGPAEGKLFTMTSAADATDEPLQLLVAVLNHDTSSWYVRMTGDPPAVETQKPVFLEFLKSLSIADSPATPSEPPPLLSRSGSGQGLPEWTVPTTWSAAAPSRMVLAKFSAGPAERAVEISVSAFPGDVGGAAANVNRWRGQMGLPVISDAEALDLLTPIEMSDGPGQLVELTSQTGERPARMIGAIVPRGDRTWFYKLVGDSETAEAEKTAFVEFLRSAKHPQ